MKPRSIVLLALALAETSASRAEPPPDKLMFAWPEMTCGVTQKLEKSNSARPIESRYTMTVRHAGENLRVSFLGFEVIDTFQDVPMRRRKPFIEAETALGRYDTERVFDISTAGTFVGAETSADVEHRMKSYGNPVPLLLSSGQDRLDSRYRPRWQDFVGNWIGYPAAPADAVPVKLGHPGDEFWLNYDVPTEVTVGSPAECRRGGQAVRCITLRTRFMPAFKEAGAGSTRHEDTSEIVLEPDTMIPHAWMDEVMYRGGSLDGNIESRYTRTFECAPGS